MTDNIIGLPPFNPSPRQNIHDITLPYGKITPQIYNDLMELHKSLGRHNSNRKLNFKDTYDIKIDALKHWSSLKSVPNLTWEIISSNMNKDELHLLLQDMLMV